ncbi:MAG: zinc ribbon domain-containing protein [Acidimicrobiia bacterium]|nr:zinc ribbon domain-containing protein [Acidimicrobiia bacterium]
MPTYDYRCDTCSSQFEFVQSFSDDALTRCPGKSKGGPVTEQCTSPGRGKVKKVFSKVGIAFKGEGFYKNDHGSKAKTPATSSSDSDSSSTGSTSTGSATDSASKPADTAKKTTSPSTSSSD